MVGRPGNAVSFARLTSLLFVWTMLPSIALAALNDDATRGWLHLNGYSHHFDAPDANDQLFGVGLTWYVKKFGRPVQAWELDVFRDSGRKLSGYVGRSWSLPLGRHALVGVTGALMYHRNFARYNNASIMPVGLPFLEVGNRAVRARAYYVPPLRKASDHQIALQVMLPLWR